MTAWWRRLLNIPEPDTSPLYGPQGVWLRYSDGMVFTDVPSVYIGHDPDDGCANYELIPPRSPEDDLPVGMGMETLPSMTAVRFPFKGRPVWPYEGDTVTPIDPGEEA